MKIELKTDIGQKLILYDENFDVLGFVTLRIEIEDISEQTTVLETDVAIEDLMPALIAFDAKNSRLTPAIKAESKETE